MSNLSKIKRDELLSKLDIIRSAYNEDDEMRKVLNEIECELTAKKFGLVWEEHEEDVDIEMKTQIPVFIEKLDREIVLTEEGYNFLLEGDNLQSLILLEKTHKRGIDLIYIDPPYNTGKGDFKYNDTFVNSDDGFKHSKWLSFMNRRLRIAHKLLKKTGVIFISIDDNEQAQLKLLCDEIFGPSNFIGNIIWQSATDNNPRQITTEHEYVLCYAKDLKSQDKWISKSAKAELIQKKYLDLKKEFKSDIESIQRELRTWIRLNQDNLKGVTHYDNVDDIGVFHDGDIANTKHGGYVYEVIHPITLKPCKIPEKGFRYPEETLKEMIKNNNIMFGKDETTLIKPKFRLENAKELLRSYYYEDNRASTKMLEDMFNQKNVFNNPKSINLLQKLISYATHKDAVILDFFAGSGSTGHAVLELNKLDGGNRRFILCTNNEVSEDKELKFFNMSKKELNNFKQTPEYVNAKQTSDYQALGICQSITYERLKYVSKGYTTSKGKIIDGIPCNLKYYQTDYIQKNNEDELVNDQLLDHIIEMIQLEHHVKIDNKVYIVLLNDEDADQLTHNISNECRVIYKEANVMLDAEIEMRLKELEVQVLDIPEYYFARELKEVGEL